MFVTTINDFNALFPVIRQPATHRERDSHPDGTEADVVVDRGLLI